MCGIFFHISKLPIKGDNKHAIEAMFAKLQHRGPNASKIRYYNEKCNDGISQTCYCRSYSSRYATL